MAASPFNDTNADEHSYDFASERALEYYLQAFPPTAYGRDGTTVTFTIAPNGTNSLTVEKLCVDHRTADRAASVGRQLVQLEARCFSRTCDRVVRMRQDDPRPGRARRSGAARELSTTPVRAIS